MSLVVSALAQELSEIKKMVKELSETWSLLWTSPDASPEDAAYVSHLIFQLAEHFGLNAEVSSNDDP
jgi:hypothetical protein